MKKVFSLILSVLFSVSLMATENLVTNGNFEDGTNGWTLTYQKETDASVYSIAAENNELTISQTTAAAGRLDITQDVAIEKNKEYTLSFDYKANLKKFRIWSFLVSNNDVWVYFTDDAKTDVFRTQNGYFDITDEFVTKTMSFTAPDVDTIPIFRLMFRVYKSDNCEVVLRNVSLVEKTVTTGIENNLSAIENKKFIKNGVLYMRRGETLYDINGNVVKE